MSTNQQEQLRSAILGQVALIVLAGLLAWFYTLPTYKSITLNVKETNSATQKYVDTLSNGIAHNDIVPQMTAIGVNNEILDMIRKHPTEVQAAIRKSGKGNYMDWLSNEIADKQDSVTLAQEHRKLNSILPTLSPMSNGIAGESIDMRTFITFMENNILSEFNIDSINPLGIQNIKYHESKDAKNPGSLPTGVGSFDSDISFRATNKNIGRLISYINTLGDTTILTQEDVDTNTGTSIMSNPLVLIQKFSLQETLDSSRPNKENSGVMTLRFFVRGGSQKDIAFLKKMVSQKGEAFASAIKKADDDCKKASVCIRKQELDELTKKYHEFNRTKVSMDGITGVEGIYLLNSMLHALNTMEKELNIITE